MTYICNISFREKANIFSFEYIKCLLFIDQLDDPNYIFTKKLLFKLATTSHILEDFLDFHGAKKNAHWLYYRELCATVRHLSLACYSQRHILNRSGFYLLDDCSYYEDFKKETLDVVLVLQDALKRAAAMIIQEASCLDIDIPSQGYDLSFFPGIPSGQHLPYDIDALNTVTSNQEKNLTWISSKFLDVVKIFESLSFYERYSLDTLHQLVPEKINEVLIRNFEMQVHNIQSSFDSYVVCGPHSDQQILDQLRSYFSIVFHILQVMGRLLHFYERHLYGSGFKDVYKKISQDLASIIDRDVLLDQAVNFCLFYAWKFLSSGKEVAIKILNENMETSVIEVGIPMDRGFHSRPSLLVAKIVQHYGGKVVLHVGGDQFDASSVLDIQWAGGKINKEEIKSVKFSGDSRALSDIQVLAGVNYGENVMGKGIPLPEELSYLV